MRGHFSRHFLSICVKRYIKCCQFITIIIENALNSRLFSEFHLEMLKFANKFSNFIRTSDEIYNFVCYVYWRLLSVLN